MQNLAQNIIKKFNGVTIKEKEGRKESIFSQVASKEISNILAAQAKNRVEVQNVA